MQIELFLYDILALIFGLDCDLITSVSFLKAALELLLNFVTP